MVRISDRLRTVAHMCEKGAVVADIGTDHGYLPIYLVQEGIAASAIAMDLRKGPLDKAKKHICDNGETIFYIPLQKELFENQDVKITQEFTLKIEEVKNLMQKYI